LSLKPAAQPAGVAGLSVRDFKPTDLQVGGCLVTNKNRLYFPIKVYAQ
jgi:hypothetical protein